MSIPSIDLAEYHTKTVTMIAAEFGPSVAGVFAYPVFAGEVPLSISIEMESVFPSEPDDTGTEQFHGEFRFSAFVVVPFTKEGADETYVPKLIVRQLATRLLGFIRGKRFGCLVGDAKIRYAGADEFSLPGKTGRAGATEEYEVWRVDWEFNACVGEDVWKDDGTTPQPVEVWTNFQPLNDPSGNPYLDPSEEPYISGGVRIV